MEEQYEESTLVSFLDIEDALNNIKIEARSKALESIIADRIKNFKESRVTCYGSPNGVWTLYTQVEQM